MEKNMKFEIDDYDLQAEGTYGKFQWMFNDGNLWIYKDWEADEYKYRMETNIQIEPFSSEKEIEYAIKFAISNSSWKTTKTKKEKPTVMSLLWSAKLMKECQESCLFGVLSAKNQ